jgi:glycosyltransferase involved in cell wall biosynthesis
MPRVSVIVAVYNGANYLAEALESVLRQDYADIEIVVVNDGSTDATAGVMARFGSDIIGLHQDNKGQGAGRNAGVRASSGNYLAFLDHDDLWERTKLSEQMRSMDANSAIDPLIFSHVEQFVCPRLTPEEQSKIALNNVRLPGYLPGTLLLSRSRFEEVGYFTETKGLGDFVDWYMKASEKKIPIILLPDVGMRRRIHLSNMGRQTTYSRNDYLKILKTGLDRKRLKAPSK